ncbi:MAG: phosphate ABC transporter substrate-binding protein PstS [Elusimicrobiales bacterium]
MRKILVAAVAAAVCAAGARAADVITLNGAGATFPYPIYSKWFDDYHKLKPGVQINYQSIGSGGGIRQITERTVDFGATDGPMSDQQLADPKIKGKLLHIPTVMGAVVPVFNVAGVDSLNLSPETLAKVFLGEITRWNDPAIAKDNPSAALPGEAITVVHRSDGSGTSFCFTDYLSKVSRDWEKKAGKGASVNWPAGIGGKGNEGVSGLVKQTPGSIGYVELIYAEQNKLAHAAVKNAAGKFVKASVEAVTAAAAGVKMPSDFRVSIVNAKGEKAYPIATFTWLLVHQKNTGGAGAILKDFLLWMLDEGQKSAPALGYAPLPKQVAEKARKLASTVK